MEPLTNAVVDFLSPENDIQGWQNKSNGLNDANSTPVETEKKNMTRTVKEEKNKNLLTTPVVEAIVQFEDNYDFAEGGTMLKKCSQSCYYLFQDWNADGRGDTSLGVLLVILSLLILVVIVKFAMPRVLKLMPLEILVWKLKENNSKLKSWTKRKVPCSGRLYHCLQSSLLLLTGCWLAAVIQSSTILCSLLIPFVVKEVVSLDSAYALTLGVNIGTTTTSLISALSQNVQRAEPLQVALSHFFFNLIGVIIFFPFKLPLSLAKFLAEEVAVYQWFGVVYILGCFFIIPILSILIALTNEDLSWIIILISVSIFLIVLIITTLQNFKNGKFLPTFLTTWNFLPRWFHSLEPYDNLLKKNPLFFHCCPTPNEVEDQSDELDSLVGDASEEESCFEAELEAEEEDEEPERSRPRAKGKGKRKGKGDDRKRHRAR